MTESSMTVSSQRPIKVMHIIARLNIGGAAVYVIELVEQLNALGYDAQLICGVVGSSEGDMRYLVTVYRIAPADKIEVIELGFDLRNLLVAEQSASPFRLEQNIPEDALLI